MNSHPKITHALIAALLVAFLLFLPVAAGFFLIGDRVMFNFLAGDSMYYMWVANNFLKFGIPTADGVHATNGFHPLWQWLLIALFKLTSVKHNQVYIVFAASAFCVYSAYSLVCYGLLRMLGTMAGLVAALLLFPGIYGLCFEPRRHLFGAPGLLYTLYPMSAINGMETPLSLLFWAIFFFSFIPRLFASGNNKDMRSLFPWVVRLSLPAIVLARLDDCFLVAAVGVFILLQRGMGLREKINVMLYACWPAALVVVAYLAYNVTTVGVFFPVSAMSKMHNFSAQNMQDMEMTLTGRYIPSWWNWASRLYPVLFSLMAGAVAFGYGRKKATSASAVLCVPGLYLVFKALFLITMVWHYDQGYWYYFAMIAVCNVLFAVLAGIYIKQHGNYCKAALYTCIVLIAFRVPNDIHFAISSTENNSNSADYAYVLWNNGDKIRRELMNQVIDPKIIDSWDGMFGYMLDLPAESYTGWVSGPQELKSRAVVGVWLSLLMRGYTLVPEFGYVDRKNFPAYAVRVAEVIRPPSSPVNFLRLELVPPDTRSHPEK